MVNMFFLITKFNLRHNALAVLALSANADGRIGCASCQHKQRNGHTQYQQSCFFAENLADQQDRFIFYSFHFTLHFQLWEKLSANADRGIGCASGQHEQRNACSQYHQSCFFTENFADQQGHFIFYSFHFILHFHFWEKLSANADGRVGCASRQHEQHDG